MCKEVINVYSEKVMEHFANPQNAYKMLDYNGKGSFGEAACGDSLTIFIKVQDEIIEEISYLVYGCTASIATSSITSVMVKGMSIFEALSLTEDDIVNALDGLPENKVHCSNMGIKTLHMAINNYYERLEKKKKENSANKGTVYSVCTSSERGQLKKEISEATFIENYGIENDGHAGEWDRQVTCLSCSSVDKVNRDYHLNAGPGDFAENILIKEIDLSDLAVGNRVKLGSSVILEITQIGKEDHPSIVTKTLGVSLLPKEGLFCKVIKGGLVKKGDLVEKIM